MPIAAATVISLALYSQQALLLGQKIGEVFNGVFDTSVPAFPLAGMLFVLMFIFLRRSEFEKLLADRGRDPTITASGVALAILPLPALLLSGSALAGSYVFAALALTTCWVGVMVALRPPVSQFLWPYLLIYLAAIGSVGLLTTAFGDPLAMVVASIGSAITWLLGLPVHWSSVYIAFTAAGGTPVSLHISQECSGIASVSILLLFMGLAQLELRPGLRRSALIAAGGSFLFIFLNTLRVVVLIVGGIRGGVDLMWSLHGWLGYVFYVLGYSVIVLVYTRKQKVRTQPAWES